MTKNKELNKKIDLTIKIVLVIIIILLLIHNCTLMKEKEGYQKGKAPNGNVDIIEIKCDDNKCVPINPNDNSKITSISFAQEIVSVRIGNDLRLIPIVEPASLSSSKLTWKSSDSSVATVDSNGVVKGIKEGKTIITVTSPNGVSATCIVNVTKDKVNVDKIILNTSKLTLTVGDVKQISSKVAPENATERELVWSSSNKSVATVDKNGVVIGLKKGTTTITVKTKDGKMVAKCVVTVKSIDVQEIKLNPKEMSLKVGTSSKIIPTINPIDATDKELVWSSSDKSVATVDKNGVVTGLKQGTAIITAKTKDGKVKATCKVNVTKDTIDVTNITLNHDSLTIDVDEIEQLIATIEPENATERELVWESSDNSIATVDSNGLVKGIKMGTTTITVKTKDGKVKATCEVKVDGIIIDDKLEVYDKTKSPLVWNGSHDLDIFNKSIYNIDGFIAPESENTYQFIVRNNASYKIKYSIEFIETNDYHINMKYKLKKNDSYLISSYSNASNLTVSDFVLNPGENDTYYLDWKWVSSDNDTSIGKTPDVKYGLKIKVEAESINE